VAEKILATDQSIRAWARFQNVIALSIDLIGVQDFNRPDNWAFYLTVKNNLYEKITISFFVFNTGHFLLGHSIISLQFGSVNTENYAVGCMGRE